MATRALATAFVNIVPGTAELEGYLRGKLATEVASAGAVGGGGLAKGVANGFGSKVKGYFKPVLASMAASFTIIGISRFVSEMYRSSIEGQKVDAVMGKVADSMGLFGDETDTVVGRLKDFATAQMRLTGIDDDVIKGAQAKLLTFKNLAVSAGEAGGMFDRATKISADMAAVFGGEASDKAVLLGKALNDPIKGLASLSRVGVQFTEDQKKMIEGMVKAGDMAGAQTLIMKELETQVGGTAQASATAGEKMSARWKDAVQNMGDALMPVFNDIINFINDKLVPAVEGFTDWAKKNPGVIQFMAVAIGALAAGFIALSVAVWLSNIALLASPITWIIIGVVGLIAVIVLLALNWKTIVKGLVDGWNWFWGEYYKGYLKMTKWFGDLAEGFKSWGTGVSKFFQNLWQGTVTQVKSWINNSITFLNWLIGKINSVKITVPDWVPIFGGQTWATNIAKIPMLAQGGFVTSATPAIIGEAGPEVVTPLKDFERMMGIGAKSDRPIYADGIGLLGWIREEAQGQATLVFNTEMSRVSRGVR